MYHIDVDLSEEEARCVFKTLRARRDQNQDLIDRILEPAVEREKEYNNHDNIRTLMQFIGREQYEINLLNDAIRKLGLEDV